MKVGIIGAGAVGSACLLSMVMRGSARGCTSKPRELSVDTLARM